MGTNGLNYYYSCPLLLFTHSLWYYLILQIMGELCKNHTYLKVNVKGEDNFKKLITNLNEVLSYRKKLAAANQIIKNLCRSKS